jgi:hypothetical protein
MAYRRLFHILFLASTLMTAVACVHWRRPSLIFYYIPTPASFALAARVNQCTVTMEWHSQKYLPPRFTYDSLLKASANRWAGIFGYEWVDGRPPAAPPHTIRVDCPIWLP